MQDFTRALEDVQELDEKIMELKHERQQMIDEVVHSAPEGLLQYFAARNFTSFVKMASR